MSDTSLTPAFALGSLAGALSALDLDGACSQFGPDGCLITTTGGLMRGEGIATSLAELIEARPLVCIEEVEVAEAGELASAVMRWSGFRVDERPPRQVWTARASAVLKRDARHWKIALLAPWGDHRCSPDHQLAGPQHLPGSSSGPSSNGSTGPRRTPERGSEIAGGDERPRGGASKQSQSDSSCAASEAEHEL